MAREIEMKIPLTEEQYMSLAGDFIKQDIEIILKSDEYYSRYKTRKERLENNEPQVIRIRSEKYAENGGNMFKKLDSFQKVVMFFEHLRTDSSTDFSEKTFFTLKTKTIKDGIELNEEHETFVQDAQPVRKLFESTGFIKWFEKSKCAVSAYLPKKLPDGAEIVFHAELEIVNGLPYIEIEYASENNEFDTKTILKYLEEKIRDLNLDPSKRDERSWKQILSPELNS